MIDKIGGVKNIYSFPNRARRPVVDSESRPITLFSPL